VAYGEISRQVIAATISADRDDRRFERFVADLFSARDGISYETTAPTGDRGIDGRVDDESGISIVCATTQSRDFKRKGMSDIDKVRDLSMRVARLHVCFSKDVKEETLHELTKYANAQLGTKKRLKNQVEAHGLSGLVDLAFRYQRPFLDNYSRDLDDHAIWWKRLSDHGEDEEQNEVNLLRIALTTVFDPDVLKQRTRITDNLVITALADGLPRSLREINLAVTKGLKLDQAPWQSYIVAAVESLRGRQLIAEQHEKYRLTDEGHALRDELIARGAASSYEGRREFEILLGNVRGQRLPVEMFSKVWRLVQERFARLFLSNGLRVLAELHAIASTTKDAAEANLRLLPSTISGLLDELRQFDLPREVLDQIARVLAQMLHDTTSGGFRWISELGTKYVVICSLGLDPELERRIHERVARWTVVPDTHVLLSYLCRGDEGHAACHAILAQLARLESNICLAQAALEESAHHAEIADRCFIEWCDRVRLARQTIPNAKLLDLLHSRDSAFVKGFAAEAGDAFRPSDWGQYIRQFRGSRPRDVTSLGRLLQRELRAIPIPDDGMIVAGAKAFAERVTHAEYRNESTNAESRTLRIEWDARLLAACLEWKQRTNDARQVIILSDSDALRRMFYRNVAPERRASLKISDPGTVALALAVAPGTSVNLECLRHFLFGGQIKLSEELQANNFLAKAFGDSIRFLRGSALRDRLDDALVPAGGAKS
jgi:hypothetical protein